MLSVCVCVYLSVFMMLMGAGRDLGMGGYSLNRNCFPSIEQAWLGLSKSLLRDVCVRVQPRLSHIL